MELTKMELTKEEIELIKELRKNRLVWEPKLASEYTDSEKAMYFDQLHALALENWEHTKTHEYALKDMEQWCFEAVMELLGKNVFEHLYDKK